MYCKFNKSKSFRNKNAFLALFSNFSLAVLISAACYAISTLILNLFDTEIDTFSFSYISVFFILLIMINLAFDILYLKTKKGLTINNDELIITNGYFDKFQGFHIKIKLSDIETAEHIKHLNIEELKKDYKNYNYQWITVGTGLKDVPLLKIVANDKHKKIYLIPCENIDKIIDFIK